LRVYNTPFGKRSLPKNILKHRFMSMHNVS
jgi:hypothetical protein